jgi:HSP20 family protein
MTTAVAKREPRTLGSWFRRGPFENLREEMEEMITRAFGDEGGLLSGERMVPSLDLSETDGSLEVRMDVPGVDPKDLDIQVNGNLLTICGQRKEEHEEKGKTFHRVERRTGSFSRSVTLPSAVEEEGVEAQYKNGILTVTLPKTDTAKGKRIPIKS